MPRNPRSGIVRILNGAGGTVGTGFVVSADGLIATCAHIVRDAGTGPGDTIGLVFHATSDERQATVEPAWWTEPDAQDLAVLRLEGALPEGIEVPGLGSSAEAEGHSFDTYGFPDAKPVEGLPGRGEVLGWTQDGGHPVLVLRSPEISKGFSGAPVWDPTTGLVLGVAASLTKPDPYGRQAQTAFLIPSETLRAVCQGLELAFHCPYLGLAAFTEADADYFYGRSRFVDELINRLLQRPRFLALLGPSGSGKSSLVHAGLIPALRGDTGKGSGQWQYEVVSPGELLVEATIQVLSDEEIDLTRVLGQSLVPGGHSLIIIDQFEELLDRNDKLLMATVTQLSDLLLGTHSLTVILILRDDFYSRFAAWAPTLLPSLEAGLVNIPQALERDELLDIVRLPAEQVGLRFESGLAERIVGDAIAARPARVQAGTAADITVLPLLEAALTELCTRHQEGELTHSAYADIGGVVGALAKWANEAYWSTAPEERTLMRRILVDLIDLGDETEGVPDRRRGRSIRELCREENELDAVRQAVDTLARARLVVTNLAHDGTGESVELIHEALIREWHELRRWLEEDRRFLRWRRDIERQVSRWIETSLGDPSGRDEGHLLRGMDLSEAEEWIAAREADLSNPTRELIRASRARQDRGDRRDLAIFVEEFTSIVRPVAPPDFSENLQQILLFLSDWGGITEQEQRTITDVASLSQLVVKQPGLDAESRSALIQGRQLLDVFENRVEARRQERDLEVKAEKLLRAIDGKFQRYLSTRPLFPDVVTVMGRRFVFEAVGLNLDVRLDRAVQRLRSYLDEDRADEAFIVFGNELPLPEEWHGTRIVPLERIQEHVLRSVDRGKGSSC
jgi:hypothetical protein